MVSHGDDKWGSCSTKTRYARILAKKIELQKAQGRRAKREKHEATERLGKSVNTCHACPNELIASPTMDTGRWTETQAKKRTDTQKVSEKERERQWEKIWEWVGNTTPNTFSIMSQHAWQDSGTRDNIQIKLQGKRTVQLLQMCRHPSALDSAPHSTSLSSSQSVARQMWPHLPFAKSLCSICWLERRRARKRREGVHNEVSILFEKSLTK